MKKLIYSCTLISILTIAWIILFQISNCYPEHGTDGIGYAIYREITNAAAELSVQSIITVTISIFLLGQINNLLIIKGK